MIINHNMPALNTYRQLSANNAQTQKSLEKLSSGLRINKAGDDAAGLAISEKMRAQVRGLDQAARNGQDAISMIQTAEGALTETHSILQRMRELATQSANGTNTDADRSRIQDEVNQLADEINRIGNTTEFNTQKLIDGTKNLTEKTAAVNNATSIAKIGTGADKVTIRSAATVGSATGGVIDGSVTIHDGKEAQYTFGKVTSTGGTATEFATALTTDTNELTVSINGSVRTITLDDTTITDNAGFASALESALEAAFNRAADGGAVESGGLLANHDFNVGFDGNGKLYIKDDAANKGATSRIDIVGGNMVTALSNGDDVKAYGEAANNILTIKYNDGGTPDSVDVTIANGTYNTAQSLAAAIESAADGALGADAAKITFSAVAGFNQNITVATTLDGKGNGITAFEGSAAAFAKLAGPGSSITLGENANNQFDVNIDGNNYNITLNAGDYTDKDLLAREIEKGINDAINLANPARAKVTVQALTYGDTDRVRFQVTSGLTGATSQIKFSAVADNDGLATLGFTTTTATGRDGQDASISYHIGANKDQNLSLAIGDMRSKALGITGAAAGASTVTEIDADVVDVKYGTNSTVKNGTTTEYVIDVTSKDSANSAIEVINNAIEIVSKERSKLGAYQNRLEHTIANLGTSSENLTAAESRVRDVDMAKEMMNFQKNNILSQAAQAMLAQANQQPQGVLQLLR